MKQMGVVGDSQAMISIFRWLLRASVLSDVPILISGETGTGKELIARAIHQLDQNDATVFLSQLIAEPSIPA
jgi:DNA-binding NtrC family response regulator